MRPRRRTSRRPASAGVIALIVLLLFSQQARAQLGLLDPLLSTTTQVVTGTLTTATGLVGGILRKLSGDLQDIVGGPADASVRVIVQTVTPPGSSDLSLLQLLGGVLTSTYSSISGYSATLSAGSILQLASDANVERISLDSPVKAHLDVAYRAVRADLAA